MMCFPLRQSLEAETRSHAKLVAAQVPGAWKDRAEPPKHRRGPGVAAG